MTSAQHHDIDRQRERTWIRYPPDQRQRQKEQKLTKVQYRHLVEALDYANLSKRSNPDKQYNSSRKKQHELVYEQYQLNQELSFKRLREDIESSLTQLKLKLDTNQEKSHSLLRSLTNDVLYEMKLDAFESVWESVSEMYDDRRQMVAGVKIEVDGLFSSRIEIVKESTTNVIKELISIAYMLKPELEYIFFHDLAPINERFIDMCTTLHEFWGRLHIADLRLKQRQQYLYDERRRVWRQLQHDRAIELLKRSFQSEIYSNPDWHQKVIADLRTCDQNLGTSIEYLMKGLGQLCPPILTNLKVAQMQNEIRFVIQTTNQISGQCLQTFLDSLQAMENDMKQKINLLTDELIEYGACDAGKIAQQVQSEISVIISAHHDRFTKEVDQISSILQTQETSLNDRIAPMLEFYLGAARFWEDFLKSVDDLEMDISEAWMRLHDIYDDEIRLFEDQMKGISEGLRRASNETILADSFQKANTIMGPSGLVEKCHRKFLQESSEIAERHLPNLEKMLSKFHADARSLLQLIPNATGLGLHLDNAIDVQTWAEQIISGKVAQSTKEIESVENTAGLKAESVSSSSEANVQMTAVQGTPILPLGRYQFDMVEFGIMLEDFRQKFVSQMNEISIQERERVCGQRNQRIEEVSDLIDKNLRALAPKIIHLDVETVQVRACELKENQKRFQRFWDRYDQVFSNGNLAIENAFVVVDESLRSRMTQIERIKEIAMKSETLQRLQALHNKSMSLASSFQSRIRKELATVRTLQTNRQLKLNQLREQFLSSMIIFDSNSNQSGATYHQDEFKKYESEVDILTAEANRRDADQAQRYLNIEEKAMTIISEKQLDEFLRKAKYDLNSKQNSSK